MLRETPYFSAEAFAASLEPPILEIGGYRYHGRILSIEEWLPFLGRLNALETQRESDAANADRGPALLRGELALAADYLRVVFPRWRLRPFWAPDPVRALRRAPGNTLAAAFNRFFAHQAQLLRPKPSTTGPSTPGSSSGDATTVAAPASEDAP